MVSKEDVKYIAELCKLKFSEEELEEFTAEFCRIIGFVELLKEVDTEGVEATYHVSPKIQPLREDKIEPSLSREKVLQNAPEEQYGYFKLPRIMD